MSSKINKRTFKLDPFIPEKRAEVGAADRSRAGLALIALGVACWPVTPLVGMLTYSAAVTLYLAYVGFAGGLSGILLWPAVILHMILTALLIRASISDKEIKT